MRITRKRNKHRQTAYTAELSEYDAEPPTRTWILADLPEKINPELEAVALYLLFGKWCGGEFTVPQKMGPNTASAISRHAGFDMFPNPIEYYPKPLLKGARSITVTRNLDKIAAQTLVVLDSANWSGSLKSTSSLAIATNANLFETGKSSACSMLATALLLAEELDMADAIVDDDYDEDAQGIAELLREVGISLKIVERE